MQWARCYLASHINTRARQILIAKSVIGDERGRKGTAGYFRSTAELAAVVVQDIFSLLKLKLIWESYLKVCFIKESLSDYCQMSWAEAKYID